MPASSKTSTASHTDNREDVLVETRNLQTHFPLREGIVRAVDGVDLTVGRRKTLGVVGESGCGKSVTARSILQIVDRPGKIVGGTVDLYPDPSSGLPNHVRITDLKPMSRAMRRIRGYVISMIFQEPMSAFSPVHTIGSQLAEAVLLHRDVSKSMARDMVISMMEHVGISEPRRNFDAYPHELSGGMRQRAMIAMALMLRPSLLIADEPTTALDVTTEDQILRLMRDLQQELGMAIMFITHDLGVIARMSDDVAVMYLGKVVESAPVDAIFHDAKHPYLRSLLRSIPRIGVKSQTRLETIKGMVPDPFNIPPGCSFHPRCPEHMAGVCDVAMPEMIQLDDTDHQVACHLHSN
jgi:oligopeptide/dipeptide ABC transporter ATP-binding protein